MKNRIGASSLAFALLLAGCNDEGGNGAAAVAANGSAALPTVPAPNNGDWTEVVTQTPEGGFLMGNPNARVKVVEYASMTCPHCKAFSAEATERLRNYYVRSGQVSFEFRNFILNAPDAAASVLARCMAPAAFFRVTEQLFAAQDEWLAKIDDAEGQQIQALPQSQQIPALARAMELDAFFRQRGMTEARLNQCLADQQATERLAQMNQTATSQHGISGTPNFLINGERAPTATSWSTLEPLIRQRLGS
jgi:protein-disulfide isomerase